MKRLMVSLAVGLFGWFALAGVLMEVFIPAPCEGCEDDLGAGLVAVIISAASLAVASLAVVLYNVAHWLTHRPKHT